MTDANVQVEQLQYPFTKDDKVFFGPNILVSVNKKDPVFSTEVISDYVEQFKEHLNPEDEVMILPIRHDILAHIMHMAYLQLNDGKLVLEYDGVMPYVDPDTLKFNIQTATLKSVSA